MERDVNQTGDRTGAGDPKAEVEAYEERLAAAALESDDSILRAELEALYHDTIFDIHASGWIYSRSESIDLFINLFVLF